MSSAHRCHLPARPSPKAAAAAVSASGAPQGNDARQRLPAWGSSSRSRGFSSRILKSPRRDTRAGRRPRSRRTPAGGAAAPRPAASGAVPAPRPAPSPPRPFRPLPPRSRLVLFVLSRPVPVSSPSYPVPPHSRPVPVIVPSAPSGSSTGMRRCRCPPGAEGRAQRGCLTSSAGFREGTGKGAAKRLGPEGGNPPGPAPSSWFSGSKLGAGWFMFLFASICSSPR